MRMTSRGLAIGAVVSAALWIVIVATVLTLSGCGGDDSLADFSHTEVYVLPDPHPAPAPAPTPVPFYLPPTASLTVTPDRAYADARIVVTWVCLGANAITLTPFTNIVSMSGNTETRMGHARQVYTLTCSGPGGSASVTKAVDYLGIYQPPLW